MIQLFHITVATLYQDATLSKIYIYLKGSSGVEIWNQKILIKSCLASGIMTSLILLPFPLWKWSRCYSIKGLMELCKIMVFTSVRKKAFNKFLMSFL